MFKVNYHPDGLIERYKAYLVAQGFSEIHGIDYIETFASIIRRESLRIFLAVATLLEMISLQMNIIGAYLESVFGQNNHLIYMKILQKCKIDRDDLVYKIFKSLYGLKQARKLWNKMLIIFFWKVGFIPLNINLCILIYQ